MKDIKLILKLNIQLFAGGGEVGTTAEYAMNEEANKVQSRKNETVGSEVLEDRAGNENEVVIKEETEDKVQSTMNEESESDGLDDGASDNEEETIEEDTEEEFISERENRLRSRISGWLKESGAIKEAYPDFDLRNELRSSRLFSQLVLAGAPVKAAYEVVHKDEIISGAMAYTADKVREQVVKNIEAKGRRPLENGISSESAVMTAVDVNSLTQKDILKILKQVENGANIKF